MMETALKPAESESVKCTPFMKRSLHILGLILMVITGAIVLNFQLDRPRVANVYTTRNPSDNVRRGFHYTCGCVLPPSLQTPQNPQNPSGASTASTLNRCYESGDMEDVSILMFSNFTGKEKIEEVLSNAYSDNSTLPRQLARTVPGYHVMSEAHGIIWSGKDVFDAFRDQLPELYLGGYRQSEVAIPVEQLQNPATYLDFPASYVGMSFVYNCSDCKRCPLYEVNGIFHNISGDLHLNHTWGDCKFWGLEDLCAYTNSYQAKCQMYPTVGIPLIFAMQRFLGDFNQRFGQSLKVTEVMPPWDTLNSGSVSFDANVLYMNLSSIRAGDVELRFSEVERGSSAWLQLVDLFPLADVECSALGKVQTCTGTSLCNVFRGGVEAKDPILKCKDMTTRSNCLRYMNVTTGNIYLEDNANLWGKFNFELEREYSPQKRYQPTKQDWLNLECRDRECPIEEYPYLVLQQTEFAVQGSSFNQYLDRKILSDARAQASGVCTKTYKNVLRYESPTGNSTKFLETECLQNHSTSSAQNNVYCWLTGRYREITDRPLEEWHQLDGSWNSTSSDLFWCYNVTKQNCLKWFIITFGILFGWLGTLELLFQWIIAPSALFALQMYSKHHDTNKGLV